MDAPGVCGGVGYGLSVLVVRVYWAYARAADAAEAAMDDVSESFPDGFEMKDRERESERERGTGCVVEGKARLSTQVYAPAIFEENQTLRRDITLDDQKTSNTIRPQIQFSYYT